jgi:hypothetical protein
MDRHWMSLPLLQITMGFKASVQWFKWVAPDTCLYKVDPCIYCGLMTSLYERRMRLFLVCIRINSTGALDAGTGICFVISSFCASD